MQGLDNRTGLPWSPLTISGAHVRPSPVDDSLDILLAQRSIGKEAPIHADLCEAICEVSMAKNFGDLVERAGYACCLAESAFVCCCQMLAESGHFACAQGWNFFLLQMILECLAGDAVDCWAHDLWWAGFISETQADQVLVNFPCKALLAILLCFWVCSHP